MTEEEYQSNKISTTSEGVYECYGKATQKKKLLGFRTGTLLSELYIKRTILDAVSAFSVAIQSSLRTGLLAKRAVTLEFPRNVFKYLFQDKGSLVKGTPGKLYEGGDFTSEFFNKLHFSSYNKDGDGCFVTFPKYMYSHIKFSHQSFDSDGRKLNHSFTEALSLKLIKSYCHQ
uniref:Uncharacterized protein n=1 Tax=Amphimedon queenslandica TaxID=400682 RepID=A0A1X7UEC6_AMPQE